MVQQVTKEVKTNKRYKKILWSITIISLLFLGVNGIWLARNNFQYKYLKDNWQLDHDSYIFSDTEMEYMAPKLDYGKLFSQSYLKQQKIWVMGSSLTSDKGEHLMIDEEGLNTLSFSMPDYPSGTNIRINEKIEYVADTNLAFNGYSFSFIQGEELKAVKEYLAANQLQLEKLYLSTKKQYDLINK